MNDSDTRRWFVKVSETAIYSSISTLTLIQWAEQGMLLPTSTLSIDLGTWIPAYQLSELGMTSYLIQPDGTSYGPIHPTVAERTLNEGRYPQGTYLSDDPTGSVSVSDLDTYDDMMPDLGETMLEQQSSIPIEEPSLSDFETVPLECLEEAEQRIALFEKEIRTKDQQIATLKKSIADNAQIALPVDTLPTNLALLEAERDAAISNSDVLKVDNQRFVQLVSTIQDELSQARAMVEHLSQQISIFTQKQQGMTKHEEDLKARLATMERKTFAEHSLFETKSSVLTDPVLHALMSEEYTLLDKTCDEEIALYERIQQITRDRREILQQRLIVLRQILQSNPSEMRNHAVRKGQVANMTVFCTDTIAEQRLEGQQAILDDALSQRSELERRLISMEVKETQFKVQLEQARRQTLDSLSMAEQLRVVTQTLESERIRRNEEHKESQTIQRHLVRRIEELEKLTQSDLTTDDTSSVDLY